MMEKTGYSKTAVKILEASLPLFAAHGFNGVAMRDIANTVGITAAALYNHFPGKETLYLRALEYAFADKVTNFADSLSAAEGLHGRLTCMIGFWVETLAGDVVLRSLLQREMSDADEQRLQLLLDRLFASVYLSSRDTLLALAGGRMDAHLLFFTILGMVLSHFQLAPIRRRLPGSLPAHEEVEVITRHLVTLLRDGVTTTP
ncbi:MAG: TetR/AcrR family transcriptional regulator [Magnetococcales bacterium]|nr:TetR/AcrR family transcriptional regulator [Magnetococcales bacterium]